MRPRVISFELEILVFEIKDILYVGIDYHSGQRTRRARELQFGLLEVIEIEVCVASGMDKVACLQSRHLCHHLQEESVGGDVERHTEECVGRALVELQAQSAVGNIKLEHRVTGGNAIRSTSATFHALTIMRRESGLFFI